MLRLRQEPFKPRMPDRFLSLTSPQALLPRSGFVLRPGLVVNIEICRLPRSRHCQSSSWVGSRSWPAALKQTFRQAPVQVVPPVSSAAPEQTFRSKP